MLLEPHPPPQQICTCIDAAQEIDRSANGCGDSTRGTHFLHVCWETRGTSTAGCSRRLATPGGLPKQQRLFRFMVSAFKFTLLQLAAVRPASQCERSAHSTLAAKHALGKSRAGAASACEAHVLPYLSAGSLLIRCYLVIIKTYRTADSGRFLAGLGSRFRASSASSRGSRLLHAVGWARTSRTQP